MPEIVEMGRVDGVGRILFKGFLLSLFWGTLLFCVLPTLAIRLFQVR